MRWDMAKVIVERPRIGRLRGRSRKPKGHNKRRNRHLRGDGAVRLESVSRHRFGRGKVLNEYLGPLVRYLRSQVSRPWDKVWSEICAQCPAKNAVLFHVHQHIDGYVQQTVWERDGVLYVPPDLPMVGRFAHWVEKGYYIRDRFYVCPRSGLLRELDPKTQRQQMRRLRRKMVG